MFNTETARPVDVVQGRRGGVNESFNDRLMRYSGYLSISRMQQLEILDAFLKETQNGMEMRLVSPNQWKPEMCSMMYLDACVDSVPNGTETGVCYAVDFGGTNLRAVRAELDGKGNVSMKAMKSNIRNTKVSDELPKGLLDKKATATMLFDEIAATVRKLMEQEGDLGRKEIGVGFTYSFGAEQRRLDSAISVGWTKGFETGMETNDPVIGQDVGALLTMAFQRKKVPAKVVAVLNDTVGTLLSAAYQNVADAPPCMLGVILGTGLNGCYMHPDAKEYGFQGVVINTEMGGFNKRLPTNDIDLEIDFESTNRGDQLAEKMISGMYLSEVCRLCILRVFQQEAPSKAWEKNSIDSADCAKVVAEDAARGSLEVTRRVMKEVWDWDATPEQLKAVNHLFVMAFNRSATMAAIEIAGMAKRTGHLQPAMGGVTVGIDGSLFLYNPRYRDMMRKTLEDILGVDTANLIHFAEADDGSGKGAAILAGTLMAQQE